MMMMMMKFIRPVLNLKGLSLYYITHFVQCFQCLLKPIQNCLYQYLPISVAIIFNEVSCMVSSKLTWSPILQVFNVLSSATEARPAGDTRVLRVGRGERKWDLLSWGVGCLFYLHVQSSCGNGELDRCSNCVHIWCPCLWVRWSFPPQVEGEIASSCVCLC